MREAAFLHFHPGTSFWYRHDSRLKLFELCLWSALALAGGLWALITTGVVLVLIHGITGGTIRALIRPLAFWGVMAIAFVIFASVSHSGTPIPWIGQFLNLSIEGAMVGGLRAFRLLVVLLAGQLMAATTDPGDFATALRKLTKVLPKRWSGALATTVSLTISFLPRIFDESATIRDAALGRGLEQRRSILRRSHSIGLPLAEATLRRADLTAEALLSRCYVDDPTPPEMHITGQDLFATTMVLLPSLLALIAQNALLN
ncbi:MAG: energy-coupling factor transporter transmembrane protein EcfT [Spirochaetales bacterium]|nr:energy-coupling factor transporter transmembrane protein EcfT [Spirochaetales bacterium]